MKPQHKSSASVTSASKSKTPLKSSESFLNSSSSQPSLSLSKVLVEKLMKMETKTVHRHTSSETEPKKHVLVRRKTPTDSQKSQSHSKPGLRPSETSVLLQTFSELTSPTAKDVVRFSAQSLADGNEHFGSEVLALEMMLTERLRQVTKDGEQTDLFEAQFQLYSDVFQQVIDKDKRFGSLLLKIKGFYETWLHAFMQQSSEKLIAQYAEQLKQAKKKIQQYHEEKKQMLRKIEKLSKESLELSRKLDECEDDYDHLKQKLEYISSFDLEEVSLDEKTWKYLVVENQGYHELFKKMQVEFKSAKDEQERLLTFIQRMKDRGFPVEELEDRYEEEEDDEDDMEPLASGPDKKMQKPKNVPRLRLDVLQGSPKAEDSQYMGSDCSFEQ